MYVRPACPGICRTTASVLHSCMHPNETSSFNLCWHLCRMSADLGSFVGLAEGSSSGGAGPLAPSPFRLPANYEEAKERKVAAVSELRNAVKAVRTLSQLLPCR